jgi:hypothetical protein
MMKLINNSSILKEKMKLFATLTVIAVAILAFFTWLWGSGGWHGFVIFLSSSWPVLIFLVLTVLLALVAIGAENGLAAGLAVVALAATIFISITLPYEAAHRYASSVEEVEISVPSYEQRAPFGVAVASSKANLQNIEGTVENTKSLAAEGENGQWNTLVIRRGVWTGYESIQSVETPLYGTVASRNVATCEFNPNVQLRLGGEMPHNNLDRAIMLATPLNTYFNFGDSYGYCDGSVPTVVVPIRQLDGGWGATWSAYGVAVLNGETGELRILTNSDDIAEIRGPVYPISLAADLRSAYQASDDIWAYWQGRSGYSTTDSDTNDPNAGNTTEFALAREGKKDSVDFVTPLTPRGESTNIVALGVVDANNMTSGSLNKLTVYKYSNTRSANSTVEADIREKYSWMPDWASGITVFEIVPAGDGEWVASLGRKQAVVYRAVIKEDGSAILYDKTGTEVVRTGNTANPDNPDVVVPVDSELSLLTADELRQLADSILDELEKRAVAAE